MKHNEVTFTGQTAGYEEEEDDDAELRIIREFFDSANLDSSGYIDEAELAAVVDLSPDEIKQIFRTLDTDRDGKISIEQFTHYYKEYQLRKFGSSDERMVDKNQNTFDDRTRDSIRDSCHSMSEPHHRKNRPMTLSNETKRKAAKHLG